jgi:predicted MFS family arabinose efflux permease
MIVIVACAAAMLSLSMGIRQSLGLFVQPLTRDIAITVTDFTLAIAMQNLIWGFLQPVAGALTVRFGYRSIMLIGSLLYVLGLLVLAFAYSRWSVILGAGLLIGVAMACTASAIAMSVASRVVSAERRSMVLGVVSAAGSIGALIAAPLGQALSTSHGWRVGVISFLVLAIFMLPAAWFAGKADGVAIARNADGASDRTSALAALSLALQQPSFLVMAVAYFVCGMQLVFITTHLPSYLAICGMDPMLSASALGVIGGFNVLGSLFFGWAGGRWNKLALLGMIYVSRSFVLWWYFILPPTSGTTIVFAALMGFLWLGVGPLVAGSVAETFGLKWQAMLQGVAFMGHQIGSFVGAFGGGWLYDRLGSYDLAWRLGVGMGLVAGFIQITFAIARPPQPVAR